ncbi:MAG: DNA repair protein RadC [Bacteroidales bacterium]|jgi:DNA repair protein RadC|nr:DNA repair protein RadC [Bacteroidales bacterium]
MTTEKRVPIKEWLEDDRPREKMKHKGAAALSDAELIAILLGSGTREESALDIARKILQLSNNNLREMSRISCDNLNSIKGIGPAKAVVFLAVFELSKRFQTCESRDLPKIQSSAYAAGIISPILRDLSHEECWVMYLNRANKLISKERISIGGISATVVDVKIVIKNALDKLASSIILVHNHPSGNLSPGENDKTQTRLLKEAASLFDISLLDHLIIAGDGYFSFADDGLM